jgi:formate--tetrahydrofolate ligase
VPAADINLLHRRLHAITSANNLLASLVDNHLQENPRHRLAQRSSGGASSTNDRRCAASHRPGGASEGVPRETGFDITPASEIMATLCLAEDEADLRTRLGRLIVALRPDGTAVTATDLKAVGALMLLLKDAVMPNLVQSVEGVPAFVHGGPFANIAHGCNSVIATKMALAHADWVVTEAGFGADLGAEKFLDIKARYANIEVAAVVLVATVRALKRHGGVAKEKLAEPDPAAVERGMENLYKHIENIRIFGRTPVVAMNRFATDSEEELAVVKNCCTALGVPVALAEVFAKGGEGGRELGKAVLAQAKLADAPYTPLYDWNLSIPEKIETIAKKIYGARSVSFAKAATRDLKQIVALGYGGLPICVAKTQNSLSDDPSVVNRPRDFDITVRRIVLSAGAGFVVPLLGEIIRMPGLPAQPQAEKMDWVNGEVVGLLGG